MPSIQSGNNSQTNVPEESATPEKGLVEDLVPSSSGLSAGLSHPVQEPLHQEQREPPDSPPTAEDKGTVLIDDSTSTGRTGSEVSQVNQQNVSRRVTFLNKNSQGVIVNLLTADEQDQPLQNLPLQAQGFQTQVPLGLTQNTVDTASSQENLQSGQGDHLHPIQSLQHSTLESILQPSAIDFAEHSNNTVSNRPRPPKSLAFSPKIASIDKNITSEPVHRQSTRVRTITQKAAESLGSVKGIISGTPRSSLSPISSGFQDGNLAMSAASTPSSTKIPTSSFRERMKALRSGSAQPDNGDDAPKPATPAATSDIDAASSATAQHHLKSPLEIRPAQTVTDSPMQSNRAATAVRANQLESSGTSSSSTSSESTNEDLTKPRLGPMEFVVPLQLDPRMRDYYTDEIAKKQTRLQTFIDPSESDTAQDGNQLYKAMKGLVEDLRNAVSHTDLLAKGAMTQMETSPTAQAEWAPLCSAKFKFLRMFFEEARDVDSHIMILTRSTPLLDILAKFLEGLRISYRKPGLTGDREFSSEESAIRVSLLTIGKGGKDLFLARPDLILAIDDTLSVQSEPVQALRSHKAGKLCPVVHLLVANSSEHINRCLPPTTDKVGRLRALVSCAYSLRHEVGISQAPDPFVCAKEVATYLQVGDFETQWRLPSIDPIDLDASSSSGTSSSLSSTQGSVQSHSTVKVVNKRVLVSRVVMDHVCHADLFCRKSTMRTPRIHLKDRE